MGKMRNAHKILFIKPEGKRPLVRPRHRWEDTIRIVFKYMGWGWCELDSSGS
jgi:hypothetical protein